LPPISTRVLYLHSHIYIYIYTNIYTYKLHIYILEINIHYIYKRTDSYNDISNVQCTDCTCISISISISIQHFIKPTFPPARLDSSGRLAAVCLGDLEVSSFRSSGAGCKKREVFLQRSCLNDWMVYSLVENPKQLRQHRTQIAKYLFFGGKSGPSAHTAIDILQPLFAATPAPAPKLHSAHSTLTAAPSSCTLQRHQHASNQRHQHAGSETYISNSSTHPILEVRTAIGSLAGEKWMIFLG
jgi:hypothetical protein